MNDTPTPPLSADLVDELLSAELDGELGEAARDLGLDPAGVEARLAATPGVEVRRAQLAAACAAIADVPDLDELTAARLRATAIKATDTADVAARPAHRRAWLARAGAIAAAVALVFGVLTVAHHDTTRTVKTASGESGAQHVAAAPATTLPTYAFGQSNDAESLTKKVVQSLHAPSGAAVPMPANRSAGTLNVGAYNSDSAFALPAAAGAACDSEARKAADATSAPVLYGTATLGTTPVAVFVYRSGTVATLVAADTGCKILVHRVVDR